MLESIPAQRIYSSQSDKRRKRIGQRDNDNFKSSTAKNRMTQQTCIYGRF